MTTRNRQDMRKVPACRRFRQRKVRRLLHQCCVGQSSCLLRQAEGLPFSPQSPRGGRPLPRPPMVASGSSSSKAGPSDTLTYASSSTSVSSMSTPFNGTSSLPGDSSSRPGTAGSNGATRRLPQAPDMIGLPMRPSSSASGDSNRLSNNSSYGYNQASGAKHL